MPPTFQQRFLVTKPFVYIISLYPFTENPDIFSFFSFVDMEQRFREVKPLARGSSANTWQSGLCRGVSDSFPLSCTAASWPPWKAALEIFHLDNETCLIKKLLAQGEEGNG